METADIERIRRPWYVRVLRGAAIAFVAACVLYVALLLHPQSREWVWEITDLLFSDYRDFYYRGDSTEPFHPDWTVGYVPSGYELTDEWQGEGYRVFDYTDSDNQMVSIYIGELDTRTLTEKKYYKFIKTTIHGIEANLLKPTDSDWPYTLIWYWPEYGAMLSVDCAAGEEELFKVAEGIAPQEAISG